MQGIMTIIFGQISHKLSGRRGHTATDSRSSEDMHPVIGDAGFAAMLSIPLPRTTVLQAC